MTFYDSLAIFIILVNITLGLYVIIKGPNRRLNWAFFYMIFSVGCWVFAGWQAGIIRENLNIPLFWERISFIAGTLIAASILRFAIVISNKMISLFISILIEYLLPLIFSIASLSSLILRSNARSLIGYEPTYGLFWYFFLVYFVLYITFAIVFLYQHFNKSIGIQRKKSKYVLVGLICAGFFGIIANLIIPLLISIKIISNNNIYQGLYHFSHFIAIIFIGFIAYAMLRYRFMDVRVIIRKGMIYTISLTLVLAVYTYLALALKTTIENSWGLNPTWTAVILIALVALGFPPLKKLVEQAVNTLFKGRPSIDLAVKEVREKIAEKTDLQSLTGLICSEIKKYLGVGSVELYSIDHKEQRYSADSEEGEKFIDLKNNLVNYFGENNEALVRDEIPHLVEERSGAFEKEMLQKAEKEMKKQKSTLALAFYTEEEVFGLIVIGERLGGQAYTIQDVQYIEKLREQITPVLAYALLYRDAISRINASAAN